MTFHSKSEERRHRIMQAAHKIEVELDNEDMDLLQLICVIAIQEASSEYNIQLVRDLYNKITGLELEY